MHETGNILTITFFILTQTFYLMIESNLAVKASAIQYQQRDSFVTILYFSKNNS